MSEYEELEREFAEEFSSLPGLSEEALARIEDRLAEELARDRSRSSSVRLPRWLTALATAAMLVLATSLAWPPVRNGDSTSAEPVADHVLPSRRVVDERVVTAPAPVVFGFSNRPLVSVDRYASLYED